MHLQVADLERALAFYRDLLGFRQVGGEGATARLSAMGRAPLHIVLTEYLGARRKPPRTIGLYHVAIRFPSRPALARVFGRLVAHRAPPGVVEAAQRPDRDGDRAAGREGFAGGGGWRLHPDGYGRVVLSHDPDGIDVELLMINEQGSTLHEGMEQR